MYDPRVLYVTAGDELSGGGGSSQQVSIPLNLPGVTSLDPIRVHLTHNLGVEESRLEQIADMLLVRGDDGDVLYSIDRKADGNFYFEPRTETVNPKLIQDIERVGLHRPMQPEPSEEPLQPDSG
ncbi:hypothetical protein HYS48_05185 [Candidatus Woesearchaeota archaeon]|nr:hypothetical protein [Candidatus Woesearchaeota archaeon]